MFGANRLFKIALSILIILLAFSIVFPQKKKSKKDHSDDSNRVMWESVNISGRNLFLGPGGNEMRPDLSRITLIREEKAGASKKYRIKDGSGRTWVAKIGKEAQPETVAVRLLWALGYKTEINYLVPRMNITGVGSFTNVRLEARPDNIKRGDNWHWKKNAFSGTNEFQGLKIMMVFFNNWDLKGDSQNVILKNEDNDEHYYIVSDLGATFGKLGNNSLPIFWRFGRSVNNPVDYSNSKLVNGVKKDRVKMAYKGKTAGIFHDITIEQGRWLAELLNQLSDKQIEDAFRAANYSPSVINMYTKAVRQRITDLDRATTNGMAEK